MSSHAKPPAKGRTEIPAPLRMEIPRCFAPFEWLPLNEIGTAEDANLLAAAIMRDPDIDCDVLFQYCDLREIFEPLGYINVALQYDALPYRKWSNPLDLKEIGMDDPQPAREVRPAARLGTCGKG